MFNMILMSLSSCKKNPSLLFEARAGWVCALVVFIGTLYQVAVAADMLPSLLSASSSRS